MTFGWAYALLALIAVQRLAELVLARRNTARLMARGAVEHGAAHYPLFILLHGSWLIAMALLTEPSPHLNPWLAAAFAVLFLARFWVIGTLGPYWTTRIISLPDAPLVRRGPFRWLRHPNYTVVALEIPLVPALLGLDWLGLVFGVLNIALLTHRIRVENAALAPRQNHSQDNGQNNDN
ncbi:isoprenylcysteine carboxyl methyltransferase family protein [Halodurantibacterium flavum]|uniref:Isoprenylcysteine carboxyl methyltransferase family protein n=1 Tax=Halodurantibacterium flavum TaxID=1382802 RepID=A0ABW4S4F2_9RHOB